MGLGESGMVWMGCAGCLLDHVVGSIEQQDFLARPNGTRERAHDGVDPLAGVVDEHGVVERGVDIRGEQSTNSILIVECIRRAVHIGPIPSVWRLLAQSGPGALVSCDRQRHAPVAAVIQVDVAFAESELREQRVTKGARDGARY